jgi:hypothetical protein
MRWNSPRIFLAALSVAVLAAAVTGPGCAGSGAENGGGGGGNANANGRGGTGGGMPVGSVICNQGNSCIGDPCTTACVSGMQMACECPTPAPGAFRVYANCAQQACTEGSDAGNPGTGGSSVTDAGSSGGGGVGGTDAGNPGTGGSPGVDAGNVNLCARGVANGGPCTNGQPRCRLGTQTCTCTGNFRGSRWACM